MPSSSCKTPLKVKGCNCGVCSAAVKAAKDQSTQDDEDWDPPCKPKRRTDIILRNKRTVKIISKKNKASRKCEQCRSGALDTRLFPTAQYAMRWQHAYSIARGLRTEEPKRKKRPKSPSPPSSLTQLVPTRRDCACELMAKAIRDDLGRLIGLSERRDVINANKSPDVTPSTPPLF